MFKICNDKTYYVVQTTSEDVVVEIYTKKRRTRQWHQSS